MKRMLEGGHEADEMIWWEDVRSEDRNSAVRARTSSSMTLLDPGLKEAKKHFKHWNPVNLFKHLFVYLFVCFTQSNNIDLLYHNKISKKVKPI